jgi:predicted acetyltransferase
MKSLTASPDITGSASADASISTLTWPMKWGELSLMPARLGDHQLILQFLQHVFGAPSHLEFQAQLEEPHYSPAQRLLLRNGNKLIGHIRFIPAHLLLCGEQMKVARICDLAISEEYRLRGLGSKILQIMTQHITELGYLFAQARTSHEALFQRNAWFLCGHSIYSEAGPRDILAELDKRHLLRPNSLVNKLTTSEITVRRWKQTEYAGVERIHALATVNLPGVFTRNDSLWRWLISREAYNWFYVAVEGAEPASLNDVQRHILGYLFLKGERIVECMVASQREDAARALLMRVCRDSMEQRSAHIRLDAPIDDPLHAIFAAAGGHTVRRERDQSPVRMLHLLNPVLLLSRLARHIAGEDNFILEIEESERKHWRYLLADGQVTELPQLPSGKKAVVMAQWPVLLQLLLGHCTLAEAQLHNIIQFSNRKAQQLLSNLLPARPMWIPTLEDLLAD